MALTAALPTLYEYYTAGGITSGLSVDQPHFTLNNKNITLYSGAMHYFRIPRQYWRDRLRKLRAAGLNTVETYVPWNLHEHENGNFDFGNGGSDMEQFLDVQEYLQIAKEEDLFAIVRPGPYICAEWEWGGLPSWLLREDGIKVRTSDSTYMKYVKRYFSMLLPILAALQFIKGGPIIAFQVENEYGSSPIKDLDYIQQIYQTLKDNGIVELLVTSDGSGSGTSGTLPGLLFQTVNFGGDPTGAFNALQQMQPNKPVMAMEYWTGWFDHWLEGHHTVSDGTFENIYETILKYPGSVNMYMFHGGTNWGFLNGANVGRGDNSQFQPTTTSYDYDAPLTEAGDYGSKYAIAKRLIKQYNTVETLTPEEPELMLRVAYDALQIESQIKFNDIIARLPEIVSTTTLPMEKLPINNNSGQSYGYIVYRKDNLNIAANSVLIIEGYVSDTVMVLINGELISKPLTSSDDLNGFGYWRVKNSNITLTTTDLVGATLDIVIENWGRGNFDDLYTQYKGLTDNNQVYLNDVKLDSWLIYPLEFKKSWSSSLDGWNAVTSDADLQTGPTLYKTTLTFNDSENIVDTFIDMQEWSKGIVIVNGFVLGRYAFIGPQQTLYLPAPFLQKGENVIIIFEHFQPAKEVKFSVDPIYHTP